MLVRVKDISFDVFEKILKNFIRLAFFRDNVQDTVALIIFGGIINVVCKKKLDAFQVAVRTNDCEHERRVAGPFWFKV